MALGSSTDLKVLKIGEVNPLAEWNSFSALGAGTLRIQITSIREINFRGKFDYGFMIRNIQFLVGSSQRGQYEFPVPVEIQSGQEFQFILMTDFPEPIGFSAEFDVRWEVCT